MNEIDGICYAGSPVSECRVVSAAPLRGGMLFVKFSSGEERLFDTTSLTGPAFDCLRDESVFMHPSVQHDFVSWDSGNIDVAPEYMYEHGIPYNRQPDWLLAG